MPLGFAAILGGTLTMVGSGPLIILNDLLRQKDLAPFRLFSVTPLGLALLASGILFFILLGRRVLPDRGEVRVSPQQEIIAGWQLACAQFFCRIPAGSALEGKSREDARLWSRYGLHLLALEDRQEVVIAPWRQSRFEAGQLLTLMGGQESFDAFVRDFGLDPVEGGGRFDEMQEAGLTGFAELVIPPRSPLAGKSLRDIALRKTWAVEPVMLLSGAGAVHEDFSDQPLRAGDTLVVYGRWDNIEAMSDRKHFFTLTSLENRARAGARPWTAIACFLGGIGLALAGLPARRQPLLRRPGHGPSPRPDHGGGLPGRRLEDRVPPGRTHPPGHRHGPVGGRGVPRRRHLPSPGRSAGLWSFWPRRPSWPRPSPCSCPTWPRRSLLVPLIVIVGARTGIDPRPLALLVAVCASNSFVLPTHQVNALLMSPGRIPEPRLHQAPEAS
ncbi:MAG: SLC13 family permease [Desulfobacterales bacterium]|nr:SLC13 family permease [Desulfobacterales bacterium]